jgi:hypothetical protein
VLLREHELPKGKRPDLRSALDRFAAQVASWLELKDAARVPQRAKEYGKAHEKGSNDRHRRAERHRALLAVIKPFMKVRK